MSKLPFVGRIFWPVFVVVAATVLVIWLVLAKFDIYERTTTDTVGSTISVIIFSYLVHLWLLPGEYPIDEDEEP